MKTAGVIFWVVGGLLLVGGLFTDVSVGSVANLHAMHLQAMAIQLGVGAVLTGTVAYGFGSIVDPPQKNQSAPSASSPKRPSPLLSALNDDEINPKIRAIAIGVMILVIIVATVFIVAHSRPWSTAATIEEWNEQKETAEAVQFVLNSAERARNRNRR